MGRTRRVLLAGVGLSAMVVGAASLAWACTPGQMAGKLWFTAPVASNGDCPSYASSVDSWNGRETTFTSGQVACVQAQDLKIFATSDVADTLYEVKYAPATPAGDMLCHDSRLTLGNRDSAHGLYAAEEGGNQSLNNSGGWKDQRTSMDMAQSGSYVVCAASVPAATGAQPTSFDNTHQSITVTGGGEEGVANTGPGDDLQFEYEETSVQLQVSRLTPGSTYDVHFVRTDGISFPVAEGVTTDANGAFDRQVIISNIGPSGLESPTPSSFAMQGTAASSLPSAQLHVFNAGGECVALTELFVMASSSATPDWTLEETLPAKDLPDGVPVRTGIQRGPRGSHSGWGRIHVETERGEWGPGTDVYQKTLDTLANPDEIDKREGGSWSYEKDGWRVVVQKGGMTDSQGRIKGLITSRSLGSS